MTPLYPKTQVLSWGMTYRQELLPYLRHPATWFFTGCYSLALVVGFTTGYAVALLHYLSYQCVLLLLFVLILPITAKRPAAAWQPPLRSRQTLWAQLAILGAIILFTTYVGLYQQHAIGAPSGIDDILRVLYLGPSWHAFILNPLLYFIIPGISLRLLGASWQELGLGRGYQSWRVLGIYAAAAGFIFVILLVLHHTTLRNIVASLVVNNLENGFFEESLMRGMLFTRLTQVMGTAWSLVISSLIFGFWHVGVDLAFAPHNIVIVLFMSVIVQAAIGAILGALFIRTRNLLAPAEIHVLYDAIVATF